MALQLEVVTPEGTVLRTEADYVGVPGAAGQFGVLRGHIPLVSSLAVGRLRYRIGDEERTLFVSGGFAEVGDDKVVVLAEAAEPADRIDVPRAEAARRRAEERLRQARDDASVDAVRARAALARATCRLAVGAAR